MSTLRPSVPLHFFKKETFQVKSFSVQFPADFSFHVTTETVYFLLLPKGYLSSSSYPSRGDPDLGHLERG